LARNVAASEVRKERASVPAGRRIYAVGDIHGRADLLAETLARIDKDLNERPIKASTEIFLGDYIDRGPQSRQVIDLLIARRRIRNVVLLKGNHEACALQFLEEPNLLPAWKDVGGTNTLLSYGVTPARSADSTLAYETAKAFHRAMPAIHRNFLRGLALSFTCGDFFFVHAGVRPGIPLQTQAQQDLLWIREDFLLYEETFSKIIVHGHTPVYEPDIQPNRINIDTGAYATGKLTCLVLEELEMSFL
jgi:serine/threonine protein phosphatase 1